MDRRTVHLKVGDNIQGRYIITARLAVGSMATCFKVVDRKNRNQEQVVKVTRLRDGVSQADFDREVSVLVKLRGSSWFPQFLESYGNLCHRGIVTSVEGEQLGEVLQRNRNFRFSNENCVRLSRQLVSAVRHLHLQGYMHRQINKTNLLLKRTIDCVSKKEVVTLSVCGLSSARLITDQLKSEWNGYYTSYHLTLGKFFAPRDDFISGFYVIAECAGFVLQRFVETTMEELKKIIHENPYRFFRGTDKWIAEVIQMVDQYDKEGTEIDVSEIDLTLSWAIDKFCETSPIAWRIKNDQLKLL